jgi:hypothetical protein
MFQVTNEVRKQVRREMLKILALKPLSQPGPLRLPHYLWGTWRFNPKGKATPDMPPDLAWVHYSDGERSEPEP